MSNSGFTTVVPEIDHEAGQGVGQDWVPAELRTEEELYAAALADPDAQPLELLLAQGRLRRLVNVKRLRERLGLTQEEFAKTYWIPLGTLRDWEQRRKNADRTAQAYLKVIEKDPVVVAELLSR